MKAKCSSGVSGPDSYYVVAQAYRDAVSVMVYKNSKLGKVFRCELSPLPGGVINEELILSSISPQALLGSYQEDAAGQMYASIIASMINKTSPEDSRTVIVGLGAVGPKSSISSQDRDELRLITRLVEEARVW